MRSDGTFENWDDLFTLPYKYGMDGANTPDVRQRRSRGATIQQFFAMVQQGLISYQGYFVKTGAYRGLFQFARYLEPGDKVFNKSTGDVYTIDNLIRDREGRFLGEVHLQGGTDPQEADRLELDPKNMIIYAHLEQRSETPTLAPDTVGATTDKPRPMQDTVEYTLLKFEPGSLGKRPFDRERQAAPMMREENISDTVDPDVSHTISGWFFDNLVQFNLYARTNRRLDGEVSLAGGDPGLVSWFLDFMARYTWAFKHNGVQDLQLWQGGPDQLVGHMRNDLVRRPITFWVRTERMSTARGRRLAQVDLTVNVGLPPGVPAPSGDLPVASGQIDVMVNDQGLYSKMGG